MRKISIVFLVLTALNTQAQKAKYDTVATIILDRMSDIIGELTSCSFKLNASYDTPDKGFGLIKRFNEHEVYMAGPNKMLVNTRGEKGHRGYWYNGIQLVYFNYTENNYGAIDAPPTIMETIEKINHDYGIEFPAADFFYPSFTDDLIATSEKISFLGTCDVNGINCFHIAVHSKDMDMQIWIANDATTLPVKYVIVYNNSKDYVGQFAGEFSNWNLNQNLPDAIFEFTAPPDASRLTIISKIRE